MNLNAITNGLLLSVPLWGIMASAYYFYPRTEIQKDPTDIAPYAESSPVVLNGKVVIVVSTKPGLEVYDFSSGQKLKSLEFPYDYAASSNIHGNIIVTGSSDNIIGWRILNSQYQTIGGGEFRMPQKVYNTSFVSTPKGYLLAYEVSETPGRFAIRFAQSPDLKSWKSVGGRFPAEKGYAAAPSLKYREGVYSLYYTATEKITPVDGFEYGFKTYRVSSKDLTIFRGKKLILSPSEGEGINTSDFDSVEYQGKTFITYDVGTQKGLGHIRRAVYPESL